MLDDEAIDLFKQRDVYLVRPYRRPPAFSSTPRRGMPAFVREKAAHVNEALLRNIKRAFDAASRSRRFGRGHAFQPARGLRLRSRVDAHPRRHDATSGAARRTNVAAELLGLHRGILDAGEPADLLLLETDAGKDPRAFRNVAAVVKDGALVGR